MSDRDALPRPLDLVARAIGDPAGDERASTFARGLALGALVGAAIAGSTIWQRRRARTSRPDAEAVTSGDPGPVASVEPSSPAEPR
jgi:hypothetical protein